MACECLGFRGDKRLVKHVEVYDGDRTTFRASARITREWSDRDLYESGVELECIGRCNVVHRMGVNQPDVFQSCRQSERHSGDVPKAQRPRQQHDILLACECHGSGGYQRMVCHVEFHDHCTAPHGTGACIASERSDRDLYESDVELERIVGCDVIYGVGIDDSDIFQSCCQSERDYGDVLLGQRPEHQHDILLACECHGIGRYERMVCHLELHHSYGTPFRTNSGIANERSHRNLNESDIQLESLHRCDIISVAGVVELRLLSASGF